MILARGLARRKEVISCRHLCPENRTSVVEAVIRAECKLPFLARRTIASALLLGPIRGGCRGRWYRPQMPPRFHLQPERWLDDGGAP
jgi:hypothetical protein